MEYYDSLGTSQGQSEFFAFLGRWMEGRDGPPAKDWKVTYPCRSKVRKLAYVVELDKYIQ